MKLRHFITLAWIAPFCGGDVQSAPTTEAANGNALATVTVDSRHELMEAVRTAKPGTKILVAPGTYAGGLSFNNLKGEAGKPIILAAADPQNPPVIDGGASGLHFTDPAYVELHDLVISKSHGNGLNIDDGGSYDTPAHHVVLRRIVVRDIGSDANHDGLKLSGLDDFLLEQCLVERWGKRGSAIDLVGCHRGVIRGCTIRKGDPASANGVQMKGGSRDISLIQCRFENAGGRGVNLGGNTGLPYFRPKPQGYEAKDITVEDCTFVGSMAPVAFVGIDGALVQHNTFYRPTRWLLRILQENQAAMFAPCRNGRFQNNIVVFRAGDVASVVNVGGKTSPETFEFAGNFWYCEDRPERTQRIIQLPTAETDGIYGQDPEFKNAAKGDFELKPGSPAKIAGRRMPK
jgi:Right handed beta helix region